MTHTLSIPLQLPDTTPARPGFQRVAACTMIILGASGDLTRRKLIPALFHLKTDGLLGGQFSVIGVGNRHMSNVDPIVTAWESAPPTELPTYAAGQWGPARGNAITHPHGVTWRNA